MPRSRRPSETMPEGWYERQLAAQGGHCAVCPGKPKTRRLHIDHDHRTGKVRGLLCYSCNRFALIRAMTPDRLRALAVYLEAGGVLGSDDAARRVE